MITDIGPKDEVHGGVVSASECRIFMDIFRQIEAQAIFNQIEASTHCTGLATEIDVAIDIEDLVLLSKLGFGAYKLDIFAEIIDEPTRNIRPAFLAMIDIKTGGILSVIDGRIYMEHLLSHHVANPSTIVVFGIS